MQDGESFLHRSGRTGRAGNKGATVVMHTDREAYAVGSLLKQVRDLSLIHISEPTRQP